MDIVNKQLSSRERTVLLLAADGLTDKDIAHRLGLSQRTIGTYWERLRDKLGHFSRTLMVAKFLNSSSEMDVGHEYRSLFATWDEGIWIVRDDGTSVYCNHRLPTLFEMTVEQFEKANANDLFAKVASLSFDELKKTTSGQSSAIEFQVQRGAKSVWISMTASRVSSGSDKAGATMLRLADVTMPRRVKSTLEAARASVRLLSERSTDYIAMFDPEFKCIYANPALVGLLGKDVVGSSIMELEDLFVPNSAWVECISQTVALGRPHEFGCTLNNAKSQLKTSLIPVPSEDGSTGEVISISTSPNSKA